MTYLCLPSKTLCRKLIINSALFYTIMGIFFSVYSTRCKCVNKMKYHLHDFHFRVEIFKVENRGAKNCSKQWCNVIDSILQRLSRVQCIKQPVLLWFWLLNCAWESQTADTVCRLGGVGFWWGGTATWFAPFWFPVCLFVDMCKHVMQ